jgi:parvulin-like peptidyl-prolyl isomerase
MKTPCVFALAAVFAASAMWAQTAPATASPKPPSTIPNLPDDTVIATFPDGAKVTMGEFKSFYGVLSPQQQQGIQRDRSEFLHQWAVMRKLSQIATERKLDQQSPYKEALEQARMQVLFQAAINETLNSFIIEPEQIVKSYESNKSKFAQVKVKAIYITYSDNPGPGKDGKKTLTEPEAKAKAEKLLTEIRGGADFVKLVKQYSEDESSREKDGDFATLHFSDNIPDAFRAAIFKLKQGEVTEPLKQPNGYYILRAEQVDYKPLSEVREQIYNELKNDRFNQWMQKLSMETKVEANPAFTAPAGK